MKAILVGSCFVFGVTSAVVATDMIKLRVDHMRMVDKMRLEWLDRDEERVNFALNHLCFGSTVYINYVCKYGSQSIKIMLEQVRDNINGYRPVLLKRQQRNIFIRIFIDEEIDSNEWYNAVYCRFTRCLSAYAEINKPVIWGNDLVEIIRSVDSSLPKKKVD